MPCNLVLLAALAAPVEASVRIGAGGAADGEVVAEMILYLPQASEFVLHGTLPVPPGTCAPGDVDVPLSVLDHDGLPAPTQVEVVSRYPDPADGADVVEILARVHRPPAAKPGRRFIYQVVLESQPAGQAAPHPDVAALLDDSGALQLRATDVFGHAYSAPLAGELLRTGGQRVRQGALVSERRLHLPLLPEAPVGGSRGTLPHLMGIHAYLRVVDGEPYLLLDLHLHNGLDGLDRTSSEDDALNAIYFRHLDLRLPPGWRVLHAFHSPAVGGQHPSGPWVDQRLLDDLPSGDLYFVPRQAHFVRRLAIARVGAEERALEALEMRHLAFVRSGRAPSGVKLWSWWKQETARYFPQRQRLPRLDHVDMVEVRAKLAGKLSQRATQVAQGRAGIYPMYSQRLGWAHPWGVQYGGMTGGDEIYIFDGLRTAAATSRAGYRLAQLLMRAYVDRQPTALYARSGRPTRVEDVLWTGDGGPYTTSTFFIVPKSGDPFGFEDAPTFQTEAVQAQGLDPWWEEELASYMPIDFQHYIRYTRNLKILAWLGNDSLAKAELEAAAEVFHLSFHQYPYSQWGYVESNGLLHRIQRAVVDPHDGLPIGRGEAWGLDVAAAAYSVGDDGFRERARPWLELVVRTFELGQSDCTGNLMALHIGKALGGRFLIRRANECAYLESALRAVNESVFRGPHPGLSEAVDTMIARSVRSGLMPPFWNESEGASWLTVGVSGPDWTFPEFCGEVPDSAYDEGLVQEHLWTGIAYAYEITGHPFFLLRAKRLVDSGDLWKELHADGLENVEGRAAFLALLQGLYE